MVSITGLSDRTIRHYISPKMLDGKKIGGAWRFTAEQLNVFINNPNILPGIHAKKNTNVYDFMVETRRREQELCLMADLPGEDSQAVSSFFCEAINGGDYDSVQFSFDSLGGQTPRIILKGQPDEVPGLM